VVYSLTVPMRQHVHRAGFWTTSTTGMLFAVVIAFNCIWWFLRCPPLRIISKGFTFVLMVVGILQVLSKGYANLAYHLYGQ
jgi:hypothetical protein